MRRIGMLLRRRSSARRLRVNLPRGRRIEVSVPKAPWARPPARARWTQAKIIAPAIAGIGTGLAALTGLIWKRRQATEGEQAQTLPAASGTTATTGSTGGPTAKTAPAAQPPTSDREPDEIGTLADAQPNRRASSPRH
jgi:hypothetical protein